MKIELVPQVGLPGLPGSRIEIEGDVLVYDGVRYDLSPVPEGGEAIADEGPFVGPITRRDGIICAKVIERVASKLTPGQAA